jgi:hypothetical protein
LLFTFFEWCENTAIGTAVRNSIWAFPVIEAIHLLGLCLLGGAVLLVDLRLLGVGLKRQSSANLVQQVRPWMVGAIAIMLTTGTLLFLSEAVKCYYNTSFWVKMTALPLALLFTFTVRDRIALNEKLDSSARLRLAGAVSIGLWFTVAAAGRWIGFS